MSRVYLRDQGDIYWADFKDAWGKRLRKSTGCHDKIAAQAVLNKWQRDAEMERAGVRPRGLEHLTTPIGEHIAEWLASRRLDGRDEQYVRKAERELTKMAARFHWKTLGDLTAASIDRALYTMRSEGKAKTCNNKRGYLSALIRWCVRKGRLVENVLRTEEFKQTDSIRRRALRIDEVHKLLTCLEIPLERRLVYRVLIGTGLRRAEARGLLVSHVQLDSPVPHLYVPASLAKSGEDETIPLSDEMQRVFRRLSAGRPGHEPAIAGVPENRRFQKDLNLAGIQITDYRGRVAVLHSTRHTFVSLLAAQGAQLSAIMEVARHRSEHETQGYLDQELLPRAATINRLPALLPVSRLSVASPVPAQAHCVEESSAVPNDKAHPLFRDVPVSMRARGLEPPCNPGVLDAFWQECPAGVPHGAPRPWAVADTAEGRERVIDELRLGDCAAYSRGGLFVVVDIPPEPDANGECVAKGKSASANAASGASHDGVRKQAQPGEKAPTTDRDFGGGAA